MKKTLFVLILSAVAGFAQPQASPGYCPASPVTGAVWNSSTALNATQTLAMNVQGANVIVTLDQTTTLTGGAAQFFGDPGDGNLVALAAQQVLDPTSATFAQISMPYTLQASTNKQFLLSMVGYYKLVLKLTTAVTGTATITPYTTVMCYNAQQPVAGTFWQTTQPVSGTFWQATQPVSLASAPTTPVTGTFWQTTQPVSVASLPALPANQSVNMGQVGGSSVALGQTTMSASLPVAIASNQGNVPVTGTFWQTTQPVSLASLPALAAGTNAIGTVQPGNTANTTPWLTTDTPSTVGGWTKGHQYALSTTVQTLKSSAGTLGWLWCSNEGTAIAYVQMFDNSGTVTLGTTTPDISIGIPASSSSTGGGMTAIPSGGLNFANAIKLAATTTATGSSAPGTVNCSFGYK